MTATVQQNANVGCTNKKEVNKSSPLAKLIRATILVAVGLAIVYAIKLKADLLSEQGMDEYVQYSCNAYNIADTSTLFHNSQDFGQKCYHHLTGTIPNTAGLSTSMGAFTETPFVLINFAYNTFQGINREVKDNWLIFSKEQCKCWHYNQHLKSSSKGIGKV